MQGTRQVVERRRGLQELPDPAEEALDGRPEPAHERADDRRERDARSDRRTSPRASAARSRGRRSSPILFSLLVIMLYITVRFKGLAFAVPVIVALLHDVLITVGVYSLTGREVTEATVAAVLTVLGYSIYDTIIIFDRIRENIPIMRRASFATIVERLAVGDDPPLARHDVHHAAAGRRAVLLRRRDAARTSPSRCSSASPSGAVLVDLHRGAAARPWKEREPEYARRKGRTATEGSSATACSRRPSRPRRTQPTPETPIDVVEDAVGRRRRRRRRGAKRERRRQRRKSRPHGRAR